MAFSLELDNKATVEVVVSKDEALDMTTEQYNNYLKDVSDQNRLIFKKDLGYEDCTRFVLRKVLPFKQAQKIMGKQIGVDIQGKASFDLGYIMEEVRSSLVDIVNPVNCGKPLEFKRGSDGLAAEDLVAGIHSAGVLFDLFSGRTNSVADNKEEELSKKK